MFWIISDCLSCSAFRTCSVILLNSSSPTLSPALDFDSSAFSHASLTLSFIFFLISSVRSSSRVFFGDVSDDDRDLMIASFKFLVSCAFICLISSSEYLNFSGSLSLIVFWLFMLFSIFFMGI